MSKLLCTPLMIDATVENHANSFNPTWVDMAYNPRHLYLVSDREIREGDWYICQLQVLQSSHLNHTLWSMPIHKIEATTDKSLGLPLIPQSFVKEYMSKQGKIYRVYIATYTSIIESFSSHVTKVSISNGEVIPILAKDTFTRADMLAAFGEGFERGQNHEDWRGGDTFYEWLDKTY